MTKINSKKINDDYYLTFQKNIVNIHSFNPVGNIVKITVNNNTNLLDKYFLLPIIPNIYLILFNVDDESYVTSFNPFFELFKINILSTDSVNDVALKIKTQIDATLSEYFLVGISNNELTISNKKLGKTRISPMDGNTNFDFEILNIGEEEFYIIKSTTFEKELLEIIDCDLDIITGDLTIFGKYITDVNETIEFKKDEILTETNFKNLSKTYNGWFT